MTVSEEPINLCIILLIFASLQPTKCQVKVTQNNTVSCNFNDTVDLTGLKEVGSNLFMYMGTLVRGKLYNYTLDEESNQVFAYPHLRGCISMQRNAIALCCPFNQFYNEDNESFKCEELAKTVNTNMNITMKNGRSIEVDIFEKFSVQIRRPCAKMYSLNPFLEPVDDAFALLENGTVIFINNHNDYGFYTADKYCLSEIDVPNTNVSQFSLFLCLVEMPESENMKAYVMLFSIPFMLLTIAVHLCIPELRTFFGKSFSCYMFSLSCAYSVTVYFILTDMPQISQFNCEFWGYFGYFSLMTSFLWLSVISFNIMNKIDRHSALQPTTKTFKRYFISCNGLVFIVTIILYGLQKVPDSMIQRNYKLNFGSQEACWFNNTNKTPTLFYLYIPIIFVICFNMCMFIMTAVKIHRVKSNLSGMTNDSDASQKHNKNKNLCLVFFRIFVMMGITWSLEIISHFTEDHVQEYFNKAADMCNAAQGFLIFLLFIYKRDVIMKKIKMRAENSRTPKPKNFSSNKQRPEMKQTTL